MLYKILRTTALLALLSGCSQTNNKCNKEDIAEYPIGGEEVGRELKNICKDQDCKALGDYFHKLDLFQQTYEGK